MKANKTTTKDIIWRALDSNRSYVPLDEIINILIINFTLDYLSSSFSKMKNKFPLTFSSEAKTIHQQITESNNVVERIYKTAEIIERSNQDLLGGVFSSLTQKHLNDPKINDSISKSINSIAAYIKDHKQFNHSMTVDAVEILFHFKLSGGRALYETPEGVANLLASLLKNTKANSVADPFGGSAKILTRVTKMLNSRTVYGSELHRELWALGKIRLLLHGIDNRQYRNIDVISNPPSLSANMLLKVDAIASVPPFGRINWNHELLETDRFNRFIWGIPSKASADYVYLSHIIASLTNQGKAVVVVPSGVLFRSGREQEIRKAILDENILDAVIYLPSNIFSHTAIQTAVMVFDLKRKKSDITDILFIDSSQEFTKDQRQNVLAAENVDRISSAYHKREQLDGNSKLVSQKDIAENDYSLAVQRYTSLFKVQDSKDPKKLKKQLKAKEKELAKVKKKLKELIRSDIN